jgi:5,10-methenyltetrahydrofolate synthetase
MGAKEMMAEGGGRGSGRGAYTTARTVAGGTRVVAFDFHVQRLNDTAAALSAESGDSDGPAGRDRAPLSRKRVAATLAAAFQHFRQTRGREEQRRDDELRSTLYYHPCDAAAGTVLAGTSEDSDDDQPRDGSPLYCHVEALPPRPSGNIVVEVMGRPRENPLAKNVDWIHARKSLEARRGADVHEVVLVSEDGQAAIEGTQTNFFAVMRDGTVYTAGAGVLEGSIRKIVLDICQRHDIPFRLEPPRMTDLVHGWAGAFLTSTSRLLLPVDEVRVPVDSEAWSAAAARGETEELVSGERGGEERLQAEQPVVVRFRQDPMSSDAARRDATTLRLDRLVKEYFQKDAVEVFALGKADMRKCMRRTLASLLEEEIAEQSAQIASRVTELACVRQSTGVGTFLSMLSREVDTGYLLSDLFCLDRFALGSKYVVDEGNEEEEAEDEEEEEEEEEEVEEEKERGCGGMMRPGLIPPRSPDRKVYVPLVVDYDGKGAMDMLRVTGGWYEVLSFEESRNRWGIPEPSAEAAMRMENALAPGSAIDLDTLIVPCVAFDQHGRRCGHGGGFYDRYAKRLQRARKARGLAPAVLVGVCLREQLVKGSLVMAPHDITVDIVVTPDKVIYVDNVFN